MSSGLCNVINVYSILNTAALNPYFWTQVHIFINRCLFHDFFYWIVKLIKNLICCIFGYKLLNNEAYSFLGIIVNGFLQL